MATTMPESFNAGTTVKFSATYGDFPANQGWQANLYIVGPSAITVPATASGVSFDFVIIESLTSGVNPGNYSWEVRASKGSEVYIADSGVVEIVPNLSNATTFMSWAVATLPLVEAAITALVSGNVQSYQIGNRSFVKQDLDKLLALKSYCESKIRYERNPGTFLENVNVTFTEPD